jgi:hypothetical protein
MLTCQYRPRERAGACCAQGARRVTQTRRLTQAVLTHGRIHVQTAIAWEARRRGVGCMPLLGGAAGGHTRGRGAHKSLIRL